MSSKTNIENFLKKELKALAVKRGDVVIEEQSVFDDNEAKEVGVKEKKVK